MIQLSGYLFLAALTLLPASSLADPAVVCPCGSPCTWTFQDQVITGNEVAEACNLLTAGSNLQVESPGDLTLRAGQTIALANGFSVSGGSLRIEIDAALFRDPTLDADGDGFGQCEDCNESDGDIRPDAVEVCDGVDNDCSGAVDDDAVDAGTWYRDFDSDGYGDSMDLVSSCQQPAGYVASGGDCDDSDAAVNPAAFEILDNLQDDDCDMDVDELPTACDSGLASNTSDAMDFAAALELCQSAAAGDWGVVSAALTMPSGMGSPSAQSHSIRPAFGTNNAPVAGASLVVLSTGAAAAPGQTNPSHTAFQTGLEIGTSSGAPPDWLAANGDAFPTLPGCPAEASTTAFDPIMLALSLQVPSNAHSFSLAAKFFSSEYPEWVCSPYNDMFVVLLDSGFDDVPPNPADKNIALYVDPAMTVYPVGVNLAFGDTGLFTRCLNGPTGCASGAVAGTHSSCLGTAELQNTGLDVVNPPGILSEPGWCGTSNLSGGGTGWLRMAGNVVPGEIIDLRIAVWDTGDGLYDSVVLLDDFRWSEDLVTVGTGTATNVGPAVK